MSESTNDCAAAVSARFWSRRICVRQRVTPKVNAEYSASVASVVAANAPPQLR